MGIVGALLDEGELVIGHWNSIGTVLRHIICNITELSGFLLPHIAPN